MFFFASAILALRYAALPKWLGWFSILIGIVLLIGPIGWAAFIFATPIWTLIVSIWLYHADSGRRAGGDAGLTDSRRAASGPPFAQSRTTISEPTRTTRSHGIAGWPCTFACPAPPVPPVPTP